MIEWNQLWTGFGGYPKGFDRNATYEWKRAGIDEVMTFRLADQHPAFNIAGLMYRAPLP